MKIRIGQQNPEIGNLEKNFRLIEEAVHAAESADIDLLLLPELATCGYFPKDMLRHQSFLDEIYAMNAALAALVTDMTVIVGSITTNNGGTGRNCFNSAIVLRQGEIKAKVHKTLLPTYDIYDELRYFEPNHEFRCITVDGRKLGITICEDIWYNYSQPQYHVYEVQPAKKLVEQGAEMIVNLSASPYVHKRHEGRLDILHHNVQDLQVPVLYSNQVGGNAGLVSDGDSLALNAKGEEVARAPMFQEATIDLQWQGKKLYGKEAALAPIPPLVKQQFECLKLGLQDYLSKSGITDQVIIGLSGGIDSTLVACIAKEALGAENVLALTMPSHFSSEGSVSDSERLAQNLGIELKELAIQDVFASFMNTLPPEFEEDSFGIAEENLQPRIRGILIMAYSNKFGHMVLNASNKSELAVGYCTLYGDMAGGLSLIGDLYKTEVYAMSRWLNEHHYEQEVIPEEILEKPPSAELRPDQKDSDSLPDYELLDGILKAYVEDECSEHEIVSRGYDLKMVNDVLSMVDGTTYKRAQAAPVVKLSAKSFGPGRRWPLVQNWTRGGVWEQ